MLLSSAIFYTLTSCPFKPRADGIPSFSHFMLFPAHVSCKVRLSKYQSREEHI